MKSAIMKCLAAGVCLFAAVAASADDEDEAVTKVATREWVLRQMAEWDGGSGKHDWSRDVTVTDNGNGTVTIESPYLTDTATDCVAISFTVQKPKSAPSPSTARARPSLLSLFVPMAYADVLPDGTITVTITEGGWKDASGNIHYFNFGSGWTLTLSDALPEKPSDVHECELDGDCFCLCYGETESTVEVPEEYDAISQQNFDESGLADILSWLVKDDGSLPGFVHQKEVGKGSKKRTVYYVTDEQGLEFDLEGISSSPAWKLALLECEDEINDYLKECRDAYIRAHICDRDNPQHDMRTIACGGNTWEECQNPHTHEDDEPLHTGHTIQGTCACGKTSSPHRIVTGDKVAKEGNTGWTQRTYCSLGCGLSSMLDHDCVHEKCRVCSAGDGCNWPCPTCGGLHNFGGQSGARCIRCQCDGCGITERGQTGPLVVITIDNHSGWSACREHTDENNQRGEGSHCVCECGDFGCKRGTGHKREQLAEPEYEDCGDDDPASHWMADQSACERCGDPYGVKEEHEYPEDVADYEWISNEKCAEKKVCEKCGHERIDDAEEAGGHVADGDPFKYEYVSEEKCGHWFKCANCKKDYHEDGHGHALGSEVLRYENVSDEICRAVWKCEHCEHEFNDDTGGHVRNGANGCLCANGCGYQFAHEYEADVCGNESCKHCGLVKPGEDESHGGWTSMGKDGHVCACGKQVEGHQMESAGGSSSSDAGWSLRMVCAKCGYEEEFHHAHHFTNCGTCDAGDGCTAVCTGCKGKHKFGSASSGQCAKCECPMCKDCTAHPEGIEFHVGWTPCSQDVEDDNYDGTASGAHCQCACLTYGHNAGTGHDYRQIPGAAPYQDYDETSHLHLVGRCSRCQKYKKTKESHVYGSVPDDYADVSDDVCEWLFTCTAEGCGHEMREEHGHEYDAGEASISAEGGKTVIRMTFTCENCGHVKIDESEQDCYHREVIVGQDGDVSFGDSLWLDCVCSNCRAERTHDFSGEPIEVPGKCPEYRCQNENGDGSQCVATTNKVEGAHRGWNDLDGADAEGELKGHMCLCGLKTEAHGSEEAQGDFDCITITRCPPPPDGCGRKFSERHEPDLVQCGNGVFCRKCSRKRVVEDGIESWVAAGSDEHSWSGRSEAEREKCVCDCGLVTSHYYAPDRTGCACECGAEMSHIAGDDPPCYCSGSPSHAKVLVGHGPTGYVYTSVTNQCAACGSEYENSVIVGSCTVCGEQVSEHIQQGSHTCSTGYDTTSGTVTFSWEAYAYVKDGEVVQVEAGSTESAWGGGGCSDAPPGPGINANSSMSAHGATIAIKTSGTYRLRARIDDSGSVSVGSLTASGGANWSVWGEWVTGWLSKGTVPVSASADSDRGHDCGFEYELELVQ